jgi:hypothetical protein
MTASTLPAGGLAARHLAMLRAVAAGRAELTCSNVPDLFVDGRCCTDHAASALLVTAGLIAPAMTGRSGERVPARLTLAAAPLLDLHGSRPDPATASDGYTPPGRGLPTPTDGVESTRW